MCGIHENLEETLVLCLASARSKKADRPPHLPLALAKLTTLILTRCYRAVTENSFRHSHWSGNYLPHAAVRLIDC